jgi:hypothetical protein
LSASGDEERMHDLVETILLIANSSSELEFRLYVECSAPSGTHLR